MREILQRLKALLGREAQEAKMEEELAFHIERETEKYLRQGLDPAAARRKALIAFGGVERFREQTREERGVRPLEELLGDVRVALRSLKKSPVVVLVTVLSLSLGIAASATVFSMASALLFGDPGPIRDPSSVVTIYPSEEGGRLYGEASFPEYQDVREGLETVQSLAAYRVGFVSVGDPEARDRVIVEMVSGNYFQVLGVDALLGRTFQPDETVVGRAERAFVLSHRAWQTRFAGDRGVLGSTIELDGQPFTVIGVAPEGMVGRYLRMDVEGWIPLGTPGGIYRATSENLADRASRQFFMIGRMRPGRGVEDVQTELAVLSGRMHAQYGADWEDNRGQGRTLTAVSEAGSRLPPGGRAAILVLAGFFLGAAFLVLGLACSNVASLLLARAHGRAKEMAVRTALGAGRGRLVRMLLTESLLLSLLGGGLGLYLTSLATRYFNAVPLPIDVPLRFAFSVDGSVAVFTLAVSVGASILAGIAPALYGSRADLTSAMKRDQRFLGRPRRRVTLRGLLVVGQVAAAAALVFGAALAVRSVKASDDYDLGLDARNVAVMWKEPPEEELEPDDLRDYFLRLADRILAHPEVEAVALARNAEAHPFMEGLSTAVVEVEGGEASQVPFNAVTSGYMDLLHLPLIRGRGIQETDVAGGNPVAVVNETFLERFLPGSPGVGDQVNVSAWLENGARMDRIATSLEVVGVVAAPLRPGGGRAPPFFWIPFSQDVPVRAVIHARGRTGAEAVVPILRAEAPPRSGETTLFDPGPYQALIDYRFLGQRMASTALTYVGLFALALAFIGVFGIVSFSAGQRLREMAIRRAMGARRDQVVRGVVGHGLRTTGVGLLLGLLVAVPLAFLFRSLLLGVAPLDPLALGVVTSVLLFASLLAGLVPAWRLRSVDPMEVLKDE